MAGAYVHGYDPRENLRLQEQAATLKQPEEFHRAAADFRGVVEMIRKMRASEEYGAGFGEFLRCN